jgi:hydrogenase nickel incorporation protein HypA/HybF
MHELGMCEGILDAALRRAGGRRLAGVTVRVGVLHRAVGPAMAQAFELVSMGTGADGASLDVVTVPATVVCLDPACGARTEVEDPLPLCPVCGGPEVRLEGGDELVLESIRLVPGQEQEGAADVSRHSG